MLCICLPLPQCPQSGSFEICYSDWSDFSERSSSRSIHSRASRSSRQVQLRSSLSADRLLGTNSWLILHNIAAQNQLKCLDTVDLDSMMLTCHDRVAGPQLLRVLHELGYRSSIIKGYFTLPYHRDSFLFKPPKQATWHVTASSPLASLDVRLAVLVISCKLIHPSLCLETRVACFGS